jgi:hypothetical protein
MQTSICALHIRPSAYLSQVTRLKQFAFARWKRVRACPQHLATQSSLALTPMAIRTVYSSFSFEQFKQGEKVLTCPSGTPWTWCLNKRCTVNPSNPKKAICTCDVLRTGGWITLGGNCDSATCTTGYWSGATPKDFSEASAFMVKALSLDQSPVKWCQAVNA